MFLTARQPGLPGSGHRLPPDDRDAYEARSRPPGDQRATRARSHRRHAPAHQGPGADPDAGTRDGGVPDPHHDPVRAVFGLTIISPPCFLINW